MNENMNSTPGGVGCIAWLGVGVANSDVFAQIHFWALVAGMIGCCVVMGICVSILLDCRRERKQKEYGRQNQ